MQAPAVSAPRIPDTQRVPSKKSQAAQSESFEAEFDKLGSIVSRLEDGKVPLEEMLRLYEEGMNLAEKLRAVLSQAELRVEKLSRAHEENLQPSMSDDDDATDASIESFLLE